MDTLVLEPIERKEKMDYLWNESQERWSLTGSGKFQLNVTYAGVEFEVKYIDKDRCREELQTRIVQAIELNIIKLENK